MITINDTFKIIKQIEEEEKRTEYLNRKIQTHRNTYEREVTPKGRYSKGYADTMTKLAGPVGTGSTVSKKERKSLVRWIFQKSKGSKRKDPYNQGEIKAIIDYKKINRKRGLNIYDEKLNRKR